MHQEQALPDGEFKLRTDSLHSISGLTRWERSQLVSWLTFGVTLRRNRLLPVFPQPVR